MTRPLVLRFLIVVLILIAMYYAARALDLPLFADPTPWLGRERGTAALISIGILGSDVVLPIPSSLVMIANGRVFGVVLGAAVSIAGTLASSVLGFWLGRRTACLSKKGSPPSAASFDGRGSSLGLLAIAVSRPVPVLAEAVAITAGTTKCSWHDLLLGSFLGALPCSALYAWAGSRSTADNLYLVFGLTLLLAGLLWWFGRRRAEARESSSRPSP